MWHKQICLPNCTYIPYMHDKYFACMEYMCNLLAIVYFLKFIHQSGIAFGCEWNIHTTMSALYDHIAWG